MKIGIVRGDFANPWELHNFQILADKHELTLFTGLKPVTDLSTLEWLNIVRLPSPVDLNFGRISRLKMALLNRLFTDAHLLFGLEEKLKGFDIACCAETYYHYTQQCLDAKKLGFIKKVISVVWENIPFNNEGIWGRRVYKQRAIREVDKFIAITDAARDVLIREGCDPAKIVRANPGVDLSLFRPIDAKKGKNIKLLFVGRLVEEKGISDIVRIFKKLHQKYPKTELIVAGSGPLAEKIKGEGVTYLREVAYPEMPRVYSSCDIYVHYSKGSKTWIEQYGFTLIETMACGLPVVGLDRGSVKEVVGPGGLVVSEKVYPSALEKVISNNSFRQKLARTALKFARKTYDAEKYGQQLEKIFKDD